MPSCLIIFTLLSVGECYRHTRIQPLDRAVLECDKHEKIVFNHDEMPIMEMNFNDLNTYTTHYLDPSADALVDHIQMYKESIAITFSPTKAGIYSCLFGDQMRVINVTIDEVVTMEVTRMVGGVKATAYSNETIYLTDDNTTIILDVYTARGSPPFCVLSIHPVYGGRDSDLDINVTKQGEGKFVSKILLNELDLTLPVKIGLHCDPWEQGVGDSRGYLLVSLPRVCGQPAPGPLETRSDQKPLEDDCQLLQLVTCGIVIISCWITIATNFTLLYYKK